MSENFGSILVLILVQLRMCIIIVAMAKKQSCAAFIDLAEAFGIVDHALLKYMFLNIQLSELAVGKFIFKVVINL